MTGSRWFRRALFVATALLAWVVASPAYARTGALSVASVASFTVTASSGAAPPMSLRGEEPTRPAGEGAGAPLCDMRCATTFAPAPQFQDEEVSLALTDDDDVQLEASRVLPGSPHDPPGTAAQEPCTVGPPVVSPLPASGALSPLAHGRTHGLPGVPSSLERPPR